MKFIATKFISKGKLTTRKKKRKENNNLIKIHEAHDSKKNFYKCELCAKIFSYKKNLLRHNREIHTKENKSKCPFCFKNVVRLREHIQRCPKSVLNKISSFFINEVNLSELINSNDINDNNILFSSSNFKSINKKIGEGTFGVVYFGISLRNKNFPVAIKIIKKSNIKFQNFENEVNILKELENEIYFPKHLYSEFSKKNKIIIQSMLGPNLKQLKGFCGGKFPIYTILNIGIDLLKRVRALHGHGILHRDIKPSNILYGNLTTNNIIEKDSLYLIDFGISKKYIINNIHEEYSANYKFVGTSQFASRHALNYEKLSRRDDIESILYTLVYLYKGSLPWAHFKDYYVSHEKYKIIKENMDNIEPENLFSGLPHVFQFIYKNTIMLDFKEEPPYEYFITLLEKEKNKILLSDKNTKKFRFIWTDIIKEYLCSKQKENSFSKLIQNLFYNLDIDTIKKYFDYIKVDSLSY